MSNHEAPRDNHEQEPSPANVLAGALDTAWEEHEKDRTPGREHEHARLTLYTPPDEDGRFSKLVMGPYGYQGNNKKMGVIHKEPGILGKAREITVTEEEEGRNRATEFIESTHSDDLVGALNIHPDSFRKPEDEYLVELAGLISQATPEKPKGRMSRALGRVAAKFGRRS